MSGNQSLDEKADVCLVLEGGFPETTGGVSVWVNQLVSSQPDLRFAIANLRPEDELGAGASAVATLPQNASVLDLPIDPERGADAASLPEAAVYHACITGHASDTAARAADLHERPMLLTEHGLAWREAGWISGCNPGRTPFPKREREERIRRITQQARAAYARADAITTVCSANLDAQRSLGAPRERSRVIPNPVTSIASQPQRAEADRPFTVGFVGRVVPVKDLETLIRAAAAARGELPVELVIVGPLDHDPEYATRCRSLVQELDVAPAVSFVGEADPSRWYGRFDAVALTSRSEAQPLVLLEAMAAGLPMVATRVGGCEELLAGPVRGARFALAGLLVPPSDPQTTAEAIVGLARDPELCRRLGAAGRERARQHHHPAHVWGAYRDLYEQAAA